MAEDPMALKNLRAELSEAREQQAATAGILRVIASSPADLDRVLTAVAESAARLCDADNAMIFRTEDGHIWPVVRFGSMPVLARPVTMQIDRTSIPGRAIVDRESVHVPDVEAVADREFPLTAPISRGHGVKSALATPLIFEGVAIGAIYIRRAVLRPFTDQQIALLETFADQAVIAIENARLFQEVQARTSDLSRALERQTAIGEVLRVIASSPVDLPSVLHTIAASAQRLCGAGGATIALVDGEVIRNVASSGDGAVVPIGHVQPLSRRIPSGRVILDSAVAHIPDVQADEARAEYPDLQAFTARTLLHAPLMRAGAAIGSIRLGRNEQRPFDASEIALLENFADQAVIAIENARLFQELADLNRTLEARVADQVAELERVGRLRRFLAPQLADLIVSSGDESILESHRRQITVVFCDLRGFTAFAETAEPEEVMAVLDEYHRAMGEQVRRYQGTLAHFAGDGIMVFFNDPLPQPDHAERAVRMACAMRDRAAELARGWRRAGHELDFGVGVAVGYATLGRIGFEGRYDYTAIGTVANLAARLCGEAAAGQMLIPARLHAMVQDLVEAETAGELSLKGFHRPVPALNVTRLRDGGSPDDALATQ
jgi:class 3 adenylate cyclase